MAQFQSSDGVMIVYDDLGPRDGVPVVLCHGLAAAGEQLSADAVFFAERGHRVLVPDLRGHGRSGRPAVISATTFSIARMAQDLVEMLEHAEAQPVHWVGNSLGGILALQMLGADEARFRTLATFGTCYALSLPSWAGVMIPVAYGIMGAGLTATLTARGTTRNAAARVVIAKLIRQFDPKIGQVLTSILARYDLMDNATKARLPILLMRGGRDVQINAGLGPTLAAMRGRENFTLVELPEGGHCANLDATEMWRDELLKFWSGR